MKLFSITTNRLQTAGRVNKSFGTGLGKYVW